MNQPNTEKAYSLKGLNEEQLQEVNVFAKANGIKKELTKHHYIKNLSGEWYFGKLKHSDSELVSAKTLFND